MPSSSDLVPLVYDELRRLAAEKLACEAPDLTLQPTALVHEAYVRLADWKCSASWWGRAAFFAAAAEAMRRILVDQARKRNAVKAGGQFERLPFIDTMGAIETSPMDLLVLDEVLTELEQHDFLAAELVKLRFFAGFTHQDAAEFLQIERRAADRLWALARTWLYRRLTSE